MVIIVAFLDVYKINHIYNKIYENFIQEIDAIDNGISQSEEEPRQVNCSCYWCMIEAVIDLSRV